MTNKYDVVTMEDLYSQNSEGVFPLLLDLKFGNNGHLYFVNDTSPVMFDGNLYSPSSFSFIHPKEDGKSIQNTTLNIPTIDARIKRIIKEIRNTNISCSVKAFFVKFVNDDNIKYQFHPMSNFDFIITDGTDNGTKASFTLVYKHSLALNIPRDYADRIRCPSAK